MASRAVWVILAVAVPVLCGGCGTLLGNGGLVSRNGGLAPPRYMEPYGGVKTCLELGVNRWRIANHPDLPDAGMANPSPRMFFLLAGAYMLAVDLPLSTVADTLMLPWTVRATLTGEARAVPIRWWRERDEAAPDEATKPSG
jgi:uncharacterized protein YceK